MFEKITSRFKNVGTPAMKSPAENMFDADQKEYQEICRQLGESYFQMNKEQAPAEFAGQFRRLNELESEMKQLRAQMAAANGAWTCLNCGNTNGGANLYCGRCGSPKPMDTYQNQNPNIQNTYPNPQNENANQNAWNVYPNAQNSYPNPGVQMNYSGQNPYQNGEFNGNGGSAFSCPRCGTKLDPNAVFCPECGAPVSRIPEAEPRMQDTPVNVQPNFPPYHQTGEQNGSFPYGQPNDDSMNFGGYTEDDFPGAGETTLLTPDQLNQASMRYEEEVNFRAQSPLRQTEAQGSAESISQQEVKPEENFWESTPEREAQSEENIPEEEIQEGASEAGEPAAAIDEVDLQDTEYMAVDELMDLEAVSVDEAAEASEEAPVQEMEPAAGDTSGQEEDMIPEEHTVSEDDLTETSNVQALIEPEPEVQKPAEPAYEMIRFCPNCGTPTMEGAIFCGECGYRLRQ